MVKFVGYNRPLKRKVEFDVEEVVSIPTSRGVKWHIRGDYEGKKMSAFASEAVAKEISTQLITPLTIYDAEELVPNHILKSAEEVPEDSDVPVLTDSEVEELKQDDGMASYDLDPKYLKKDGTPDLRYKVAREWLAMAEDVPMAILEAEDSQVMETLQVDGEYTPHHEISHYENRDLTHSSVVEGDNSLDAMKYTGSAETYSAPPPSPPPDICFREHIPPEIWMALSPHDKRKYMSTKDEDLLVCATCNVSKADLRIDEDANSECHSCSFSGDDFAPRWWIDSPPPSPSSIIDKEEDMITFMGASQVIPQELYHNIMLYLPETVYAEETEDGLSYNLSYHQQSEPLVSALIETHGLKPTEAIIEAAEEFEAEPVTLQRGWAEDLTNYGAESFIPFDSEELMADGETMSVSEFYGNVFDFKDSDDVYTTFNGNVIVVPDEPGGNIFNAEEDEYDDDDDYHYDYDEEEEEDEDETITLSEFLIGLKDVSGNKIIKVEDGSGVVLPITSILFDEEDDVCLAVGQEGYSSLRYSEIRKRLVNYYREMGGDVRVFVTYDFGDGEDDLQFLSIHNVMSDGSIICYDEFYEDSLNKLMDIGEVLSDGMALTFNELNEIVDGKIEEGVGDDYAWLNTQFIYSVDGDRVLVPTVVVEEDDDDEDDQNIIGTAVPEIALTEWDAEEDWEEGICAWCSSAKADTILRGEAICSTCKEAWIEQPDDGGFWAEEFEASINNRVSMMKHKGRVKTLSGKPHTPRKLIKDKDITPEEMAQRTKVEAESFEADDCYVCGAEGIETAKFGGKNVCSSCTDWKYEADTIEILDLPHGWCDKCGAPGFANWEHNDRILNLCKQCYIMHFYNAEEDNLSDGLDSEYVSSPKPTTIATLVGLGALAAWLAPNQIRQFFKK